MKSKKTNRKFYNKWLYKISLKMHGAYAFRVYTLEDIKNIFTGNPNAYKITYFFNDLQKNKKEVIDLADFLLRWDVESWTKRIERNCLDLYTNDREFYDKISETFEKIVIHRFEPDESSIEKLEETGTIVSKRLPHNRYKYRLYLQPHKMNHDLSEKKRYITWLKTQVPRITLTEAVENWFIKTDWNWDRRYILVEDENTLLMLKLKNPEVVGKVYTYQVRDK